MTKKRTASSPPASRGTEGAKEPIRRRDGAGHIEPGYAAELREIGHERTVPDAAPFIAGTHTRDELAEQLGEHAVQTATSGEDQALSPDDNVPEDLVSPFRTASSRSENEEEEA